MNNASRTEKRNRKLISHGIIAKRIHKESFKSLKQVIALEGYRDDGKTSVIKTLIGELYRRDPKSWKGYRRFNPDKVKITGAKCESEYSAVFCYRGVTIAIYSRGDNPSVILRQRRMPLRRGRGGSPGRDGRGRVRLLRGGLPRAQVRRPHQGGADLRGRHARRAEGPERPPALQAALRDALLVLGVALRARRVARLRGRGRGDLEPRGR